MGKDAPSPQEEAEALRAVIREAHEMSGTLRRMITEGRDLIDNLANTKIDEAVTASLDKYVEEVAKLTKDTGDRIVRQLEGLVRVLKKNGLELLDEP